MRYTFPIVIRTVYAETPVIDTVHHVAGRAQVDMLPPLQSAVMSVYRALKGTVNEVKCSFTTPLGPVEVILTAGQHQIENAQDLGG